MAIPNRFDIVQAVNAAHPQLIRTNTRATATEFLWRVVTALAAEDPRFGFLSKLPAENHVEIPGAGLVSIDAISYQGEYNVIDIIGSAGDGPGSGAIGWSETDQRRATSIWIAAVPFPGAPTPPSGGTPPDSPTDLLERIGKAEAKLKALEEKISGAALDSAEALVLAQQTSDKLHSLRVKGTIDLPVVLSGFRGRAKGDINLAVGE